MITMDQIHRIREHYYDFPFSNGDFLQLNAQPILTLKDYMFVFTGEIFQKKGADHIG